MRTPLLATLLVTLSATAFAQGPGPGPGPGARGGPRFGEGVTPGWKLMSPEERREHQERMRAMQDPAECEAYMTEHHRLMESRAKERNQALPWKGPRPFCDFPKRKPA